MQRPPLTRNQRVVSKRCIGTHSVIMLLITACHIYMDRKYEPNLSFVIGVSTSQQHMEHEARMLANSLPMTAACVQSKVTGNISVDVYLSHLPQPAVCIHMCVCESKCV